MKRVILAAVLVIGMITACTNSKTKDTKNTNNMNTTLNLTQEWDKTFSKSDKVDHKKVTFRNRYGIEHWPVWRRERAVERPLRPAHG